MNERRRTPPSAPTGEANDAGNGAAPGADAPVLCLLDAPWRRDPTLAALFDALGRRDARVVGGAVRNALLGLPVRDVDVATRLDPQTVMRRAKAAGFSTHPVGLSHGSVIVARDGRAYEVTTLRRDVETDGRHARVAFTDDWAEDARRRDFTMNALYADVAGDVFDPLGGLPDLMARRVRFIGDAAARIREDYLRILRFFRFWAQYDTGPPDPPALSAIRAQAPGLERISRERIREETMRLLVAPRVIEALAWMRACAVARRIFPDDCDGHDAALATMIEADADFGLPPEWLLRLVAWCGPRRSLAEAFRLTREEAARVHRLRHVPPPPVDDEAALRALLYRHGRRGALDVVRLAVAAGRLPSRTLARLVELMAGWEPPVFPLAGRDVLALGIAPGPHVGQLLREVETAWVDDGFRPSDRRALLTALAAAARRRGLLPDDGRKNDD